MKQQQNKTKVRFLLLPVPVVLLPVTDFQVERLGIPRASGLAGKDRCKEGIKNLSLFLSHVPHRISKGWRLSLALLLLLIYLEQHFFFCFVILYHSGQVELTLGFGFCYFYSAYVANFLVLSLTCPSLFLLDINSGFVSESQKKFSVQPFWSSSVLAHLTAHLTACCCTFKTSFLRSVLHALPLLCLV